MILKAMLAIALLGVGAVSSGARAAEPVPVKDFVRHAEYSEAKISPDGTYLALTALQGEITVLAVVRLKDMVVVRTTRLSEGKSIGEIYWVGPKRLMFTATRNIGSYAQPFGTGEWFASDFDGCRPRTLVNYLPQPLQARNKIVHYTQSYGMLDPLPGDETSVLMSVHDSSSDERTQVVSLDTVTGRRRVLARAPRDGHCEMVLDASHQPRYANCFDTKGEDGTYAEHSELYRRDDSDQWTLVNGSAKHDRAVNVVGTAGDGRIYALSRVDGKPATFGELDSTNNQFKALYQDPSADPYSFIMASDGNTVLGVITMAGAPHVDLVERNSRDVAIYVALSKAFPDKLIGFSGATLDGSKIVVSVHSDTDPGQLYLYDRDTSSVRFLMRNRSWLDPAKMAVVRPFSFKARDGVMLHGYLTMPRGNDRDLPTIINPHGGPIGLRDDWGFNWETQMFANRGYLVVQLNFRGSGGYGQAFQDMGHRQWGEKMQDDLTDVTHWVIDQGHADPGRICIYGGSYGGYASLMGVAKQPDLYRCAVGYVGVYDLEMMYHKGDISERASGKRYLERTLGHDTADLQSRSPARLAAKIKAPVFLAAGGRDVRAPKDHTEEMRDALKSAGHPAEVVIVEPNEMHGFYDETANLNLYTKMLAFFDKYIGAGATAQAATAGGH